jgi:hypothetical protein
MIRRPARLAAALAAAALLALPGATLAGEPAGSAAPAAVIAWQEHRDNMQTMGPNTGAHVRDCVEMHGSVAGQLGPKGMMVHGMGDMTGEGNER